MSNFCSECFKEVDVFNPCVHQRTSSSNSNFDFKKSDDPFAVSKKQSAMVSPDAALVLAPISGLLLDAIIPNWSSPLIAILLGLLAGSIFTFVWRQRVYKFKFNPIFYIKNFPAYVIPVIGSEDKKRSSVLWGSGLLITVLLQVLIHTPGNANFLENSVRRYINDTANLGLNVECPNFGLVFPGQVITCEVGTGVFGITVPARVVTDPLTGAVTIKVSLN